MNNLFRIDSFNELYNKLFIKLHYIFLGDKTHLHIYLRKLRLSITSSILIAETTSNLEVPLKSSGHQKLLVLLRRLRKSIKLSFFQSRRNNIVTRPFRRRFCHMWSFNLHKSILGIKLASKQSRAMPIAHILLHSFSTQIKISILQTNLLINLFSIRRNIKSRSLCLIQYYNRKQLNLDSAIRLFGVYKLLWTRIHITRDFYHPLWTQVLRNSMRLCIMRKSNHLYLPRHISQIQKDQFSMVSSYIYPARKLYNFTNVLWGF